MGKRGFTLIELLGVIVLLSIIMVIAVPSINGITQSIKNNMLDEKVKIIEEAATLLGEDIKGSVINSELSYNSYPCKRIIVSNLVPDYLDKDNENNCLDESSDEEEGCIVNPIDKDNYLDKYEVIIYFRNKRIHAKVDVNNELSCS